MTSPRDILKKLNAIGLTNDREDIVDITEPKKLGITNQYSFISVNGKPCFVYRIVGKQWCCGFDRHTELYNLNIVISAGVKTGVVYFNPMTGTQISTHSESAKISSNLIDLKYAVSAIKKVHRSKSLMKNDYNIAATIFTSYLRVAHPYRHQFFAELEPLFKRIIFAVINDIKNIVSSHNEPYPSNFTIGESKDDHRMVDWEYSGNNNRYWDLAFLSVTSKLTPKQDEFLLKKYFNNNFNYEEIVKFNLFKLIVQFTLMLWIAGGLVKCNYAITCDDERLKRVKSEGLTLTRFFQQMNEAVSPRTFHFPLPSNLPIKIEQVDDKESKLIQFLKRL